MGRADVFLLHALALEVQGHGKVFSNRLCFCSTEVGQDSAQRQRGLWSVNFIWSPSYLLWLPSYFDLTTSVRAIHHPKIYAKKCVESIQKQTLKQTYYILYRYIYEHAANTCSNRSKTPDRPTQNKPSQNLEHSLELTTSGVYLSVVVLN